MGLENIKMGGVEIVVITSENSLIVKERMRKLGVNELFMGVNDKFSRLNKILIDKKIKRNNVAYIGDDMNDLVNLTSVGWSFCPKDAVEQVKNYCDIVLNNKGGDKAIREATEFITKYNKRFNT